MAEISNQPLRRKDTTKGPPLRILSLDGGGVRGYSVFIILQELMHLLYVQLHNRAPRRHEIPKPADHFDLIIGTGTGGLIAIMLGRLRLDLETCKEVYVRMTRRVFESDKTIAGVPYRKTLFKASKLEEAIRACVREHTVDGREGNDDPELEAQILQQIERMEAERDGYESAKSPIEQLRRDGGGVRRHQSNASIVSFSARGLPPSSAGDRSSMSSSRGWNSRFGDSNAKLYDRRENRTKTAVTAVYKDTPRAAPAALLRSYDSRKETPPDFDCSIWQAGRATCATGLAFKPVQIGQHTFHDTVHPFNPSPLVLDEATLNEWPGREVGVFVSVGTGKRPPGTDGNQAMWYEEFLGGEFVEAKRRLMQKIEGCEETHQWMVREGLAKRGVQREAYVRLNVEVGVGDFGMNEWQALSDISTSTRRYLARPDISRLTEGAAARLARVHISKRREAGLIRTQGMGAPTLQEPRYPTFAAELPAEVVPLAKPSPISSASRPSYEYDGVDTLQLPPTSTGTGNSPRTSAERLTDRERAERARVSQDSNRRSQAYASGSEHSPHNGTPPRQSPRVSDTDRFTSHAPTPSQYRTARGDDKIAIMAEDDMPRPLNNMAPPSNLPPPPPIPGDGSGGVPPPLPPKTPIPGSERDDNRRRRERRAERESRDSGRGDRKVPVLPPYPLDDVPPAVNMARKPDLRGVRR